MLYGSPSPGMRLVLECFLELAEDLHDLADGALTLREAWMAVRRNSRIGPLSKTLIVYRDCYKSKSQPTMTKYLAEQIRAYFMLGSTHVALARIKRTYLQQLLRAEKRRRANDGS